MGTTPGKIQAILHNDLNLDQVEDRIIVRGDLTKPNKPVFDVEVVFGVPNKSNTIPTEFKRLSELPFLTIGRFKESWQFEDLYFKSGNQYSGANVTSNVSYDPKTECLKIGLKLFLVASTSMGICENVITCSRTTQKNVELLNAVEVTYCVAEPMTHVIVPLVD